MARLFTIRANPLKDLHKTLTNSKQRTNPQPPSNAFKTRKTMPIQFIDGSEEPGLETWRGELLMAAAQSLVLEGAILNENDVHNILEREKPDFLRVWGPVPGLKVEKLHAA